MLGQPMRLESPVNALGRVLGVQNQMQQNALNGMQMQGMQDQRADVLAQRQAQQAQAQARAQALAQLPPPPEDAPPQMHTAYRAVQAGLLPVEKYFGMVMGDEKPMALNPGQTVYRGGKAEYTAPPEAPKPEKMDPNKPFMVGPDGAIVPNAAYQEYAMKQAKASAAGPTTVSVNTGQKGLDNTLKLRGEFKSEPIYKAHQDVQSAYSQIKESLKLASPAGDLAGATKIMKILDPGSVVRESELGMAMAASGLLDRITNYAQMTLSGQKLTPTQRKDFQTLADKLYAESAKQYNTKRAEYKGIADRNQLPEADVIGAPASAPANGWSIQKVN
jgi:hypothetical protein